MLEEIITNRLQALLPTHNEVLYQAARYALLSGGKRLRPSLVLAATEIFEIDPVVSLDAACAIEMIHAYSLIHDDLPCMDDDDLRRGIPTVHKIYGEAMAVLAGDFLLTYAFEIIGNIEGFSAEQKMRLILVLSRAAGGNGMVGGQAIDIDSVGVIMNEESLLDLHKKKTGSLLTAALQFGAIIGNAPDTIYETFTELGTQIGWAFQCLDDLLDATSNKKITGKNSRGDIAKNKPTAVTVYGITGVETKLLERKASIALLLHKLPKEGGKLVYLLNTNLWHRFIQDQPKTCLFASGIKARQTI